MGCKLVQLDQEILDSTVTLSVVLNSNNACLCVSVWRKWVCDAIIADSRVQSFLALAGCSTFRLYHSWALPESREPRYCNCIAVLSLSGPSNRLADSHHRTPTTNTLNLSRSGSPE